MADDLRQLLEAMRQENAAAHAETRRHVDGTAAETLRQVHETTAETLRQVHETAAETLRQVHETAAETRRYFDVIAERLEKRFELLAEAVQILDGTIHRKTADLEERMELGFADTQAMIRFSHGELDRRVRALEDER